MSGLLFLDLGWPALFLCAGLFFLFGLSCLKQNVRGMSGALAVLAIAVMGGVSLTFFVFGSKMTVVEGFSALLLGVAGCVFLVSFFFGDRTFLFSFEYVALVFLSLLGGVAALSATDLLRIFLGLELQTLPLYLLIALRKRRGVSLESSLKYFVLGGLSTGCLLFGLSFLYGALGSLSFSAVPQTLAWLTTNVPGVSPVLLFYMGVVFLLVGLGFKLSLVPFHIWTPDVYEGSETGTTLFLATCIKIAVTGVFFILYGVLFAKVSWVPGALQGLAACSMLVGALGALKQERIKRLLAYSTIAHMGYIVAVIASGADCGGWVVGSYLAVYALTVCVAFACLLVVEHGGVVHNPSLDDVAGLRLVSPVLSGWLGFSMFSLAGIPPTPLFFAKLLLLYRLVDAGEIVMVGCFVFSSLVGGYYYIRLVKSVFLQGPGTRLMKLLHGE